MKPEDIIKSYNAEGSIKKVAALFRISEQKVRKVLIDAGAYESDMAIQVNDLHEQGYSVENIAEKLRVSKSTVSACHTPKACILAKILPAMLLK